MSNKAKATHSGITQKIIFSLRKSVPQIVQNEAAECGLACLAMICGYYNYHVDLLTLRQSYSISSQGATLADLSSIANHMKLDNRALALDLDSLKKLKLPCILHWDLNHFVVLVAVKKKHIVIHDPATGKKILSYEEFSKHFTGVAMELWPTADFVPRTEKQQLKLLTLLKNVDGLYSFLLKVFAFTVIVEIINVLTPIGTQLVLDHVIIAEDTNLLTVICIGLLMTLFFKTFIGALRNITTIVTDALINAQWSVSLFNHLFSLPLDYFEKRRLGDIQSRFLSLEQIRKTFTSGIIKLIVDGMMCIILIIMMYVYGGWLLWVVLLFNFIYLLMRGFTYRYFREMSEQKVVKEAKENSFFMESLYGINTIKALNLSNQRMQHWSNLRADHINADIKITRFDVIFNGFSAFVGAIDEIVVLWIGALMVIRNDISLGMLMAFTAYRGQFSTRSSSVIGAFLDLKILSLHSERIADIALSKKEHFETTREVFHQDEKIELEVNNLVYRYDIVSPAVISNISFTVKAGEHIAITGPSGVGKTTLIKMLAGLTTPTSGTIFANQVDITKIGVNNYRDAISCVLQDDKLFAGSILDNISCFNAPVDVEWAVECAHMVNMHDEIQQMAMSYQTIISELGGSLSGGQKQRLLLARALYRRPRIMFLDEATSHLDVDNEAIINASISKLKITRIVVAHRPSTIEAAERVICLKRDGLTIHQQGFLANV